MFDWIADFNTDRTFQVRVGDALSAIYTLENRRNQGSMISPELFVSMIDDLPNSLQRVATSLFADDSSLYKGGRSIKLLQTAVQQDLDALQQWCDKWGVKISIEKTVAVLFSQATQRLNIKLLTDLKCASRTCNAGWKRIGSSLMPIRQSFCGPGRVWSSSSW